MRVWVLALLLPWGGCGKPRQAPARAETTKASLFGDASLIPTRAGEQARAELALSAELTRVVLALPDVVAATATVRTPSEPRGLRAAQPSPTRAVVAATTAADSDATQTHRDVEALTRTWLGPQADVQVIVAYAPDLAPETPPPLGMLAFALLGLGATLGVTVDRAVDRRRRRPPRPSLG